MGLKPLFPKIMVQLPDNTKTQLTKGHSLTNLRNKLTTIDQKYEKVNWTLKCHCMKKFHCKMITSAVTVIMLIKSF